MLCFDNLPVFTRLPYMQTSVQQLSNLSLNRCFVLLFIGVRNDKDRFTLCFSGNISGNERFL